MHTLWPLKAPLRALSGQAWFAASLGASREPLHSQADKRAVSRGLILLVIAHFAGVQQSGLHLHHASEASRQAWPHDRNSSGTHARRFHSGWSPRTHVGSQGARTYGQIRSALPRPRRILTHFWRSPDCVRTAPSASAAVRPGLIKAVRPRRRVRGHDSTDCVSYCRERILSLRKANPFWKHAASCAKAQERIGRAARNRYTSCGWTHWHRASFSELEARPPERCLGRASGVC